MNASKITYLLLTVAAIVTLGYLITNTDTEPDMRETTNAPDTSVVTTETISAEEPEMQEEVSDETNEPAEAVPVATDTEEEVIAGTYAPYSAEAVVSSQAETIYLNFSASWCPSCRALEADIEANEIPAGVAIYKVDYDTATELKKTYGVTRQHSVIEINAEGTAVGNIAHPATLTALLAS